MRIGIGAVIMAFGTGCAATWTASEAVPSPQLPTVRVARVAPAPEHRELVLHSVTSAPRRSPVSFTVGGRVADRRVEVGARVVAGQVLATLDDRGYRFARDAAEGQAAQLEAQVAQLTSDVARLEGLDAGRSVSAAELERSRSALRAAESALAAAAAAAGEARRARDEATLRAPYDGVVTAVFAREGETVAAGQPVVQVVGDGATEVAVQLPERVWASATAGDPVVVELTALDRVVTGSLRDVAAAGDPSGLFPAVVALDDAAPAGLTARVRLGVPLDADHAVPVSAIVDPSGTGPSVYRWREGRVERVPVTVRALIGDRAAVAGDLGEAAEVVVAGHARLLPGDAVEVIR